MKNFDDTISIVNNGFYEERLHKKCCYSSRKGMLLRQRNTAGTIRCEKNGTGRQIQEPLIRRLHLLTSIKFVIFLTVAVTLYFALPGKYRPALLLMMSYLFCAALDMRSLIVLILLTLFSYFSAQWIRKTDEVKNCGKRQVITAMSIIVCILILICYKYTGRLQGMVPIGLSFYLFQTIGCLTDVCQGKYTAETSFIDWGLYLAYFPKFVSGPIEREDTFFRQLHKLDDIRFFDRGRLSTAVTYLLCGHFMKLVIADRLAAAVSALFENPGDYDSLFLIAGALFYTIQIYCDFAGYSFIAIGSSLLFGIHLTPNFLAPYFAENITDFWRRWHISLSSWLRDYIYIPLGGNRKGIFQKCINIMIVFAICGIWHGAGLCFLIWGLLHGTYSILDTFRKKANIHLPFCRLITFAQVAFAWIFFRAGNFSSAIAYIRHMFTAGIRLSEFPSLSRTLGTTKIELFIVMVSIFLLAITDYFSCLKNESFPELIQHLPNTARYFIFYILIVLLFIFGVYGPGYSTEQFIYMQF